MQDHWSHKFTPAPSEDIFAQAFLPQHIGSIYKVFRSQIIIYI